MNDERRLFYVAMTRARDYLSLSTFERIAQRRRQPSPFLARGRRRLDPDARRSSRCPPLPEPSRRATTRSSRSRSPSSPPTETAALQYRLRTLLGFQPPLVPELGYGKAVHHVLAQVAEHVAAARRDADDAASSTGSSTTASTCRPRTRPATAR